MISWFFFFLEVRSLELLARLQNTQQCICSDWKMLENQWANSQANSYKKKSQGILSKHFLGQKRARKFELLFHCLPETANDHCQLLSVNFDMLLCPYRHAHVRIRPITRRITNINPQETCLSETLTYVFATLQDVRTSFCALVPKWTIQMV